MKCPSLADSEYYSNILLQAPDGQNLSTISSRRAKWYLDRNLAVETVAVPPYSRILKLSFEPKARNQTDIKTVPLHNHCVVCGSKDKLSLHHIVPTVIRSRLPTKYKNHSHGWCVLMCEQHHEDIERILNRYYKFELQRHVKLFDDIWKDKKTNALAALFKLRAQGILSQIPEKRIKTLLKRAELESLDDIPTEKPRIPQLIWDQRDKAMEEHIDKWAAQFIEDMGGYDNLYSHFLSSIRNLEPKHLIEKVLVMPSQIDEWEKDER